MPSVEFIRHLQRLFAYFQRDGGVNRPIGCSLVELIDEDDLTNWFVQLAYKDDNGADFFIALRLSFSDTVAEGESRPGSWLFAPVPGVTETSHSADVARGGVHSWSAPSSPTVLPASDHESPTNENTVRDTMADPATPPKANVPLIDAAGPPLMVAAAARPTGQVLRMPFVFIISPRLSASFIHQGAVCSLELMTQQWEQSPANVSLLITALHETLNPFLSGSRVSVEVEEVFANRQAAAGGGRGGHVGLSGYSEEEHQYGMEHIRRAHRHLFRQSSEVFGAMLQRRSSSDDSPPPFLCRSSDDVTRLVSASTGTPEGSQHPTPRMDRSSSALGLPCAGDNDTLGAGERTDMTSSTLSLSIQHASVARRAICDAVQHAKDSPQPSPLIAMSFDTIAITKSVDGAGCCEHVISPRLYRQRLVELWVPQRWPDAQEGRLDPATATSHVAAGHYSMHATTTLSMVHMDFRPVEDPPLQGPAVEAVHSARVAFYLCGVPSVRAVGEVERAAVSGNGSGDGVPQSAMPSVCLIPAGCAVTFHRLYLYGHLRVLGHLTLDECVLVGTISAEERGVVVVTASHVCVNVDDYLFHCPTTNKVLCSVAEGGLGTALGPALAPCREGVVVLDSARLELVSGTLVQRVISASARILYFKDSLGPASPSVVDGKEKDAIPVADYHEMYLEDGLEASEAPFLAVLRSIILVSNCGVLRVMDSRVEPSFRTERTVFAEQDATVEVWNSSIVSGRVSGVSVQGCRAYFDHTVFEGSNKGPELQVYDASRSTGLNVELGGTATVRHCVARHLYFGYSVIAHSVAHFLHCHAVHVVNGYTVDASTATLENCTALPNHVGIFVLHRAKCIVTEDRCGPFARRCADIVAAWSKAAGKLYQKGPVDHLEAPAQPGGSESSSNSSASQTPYQPPADASLAYLARLEWVEALQRAAEEVGNLVDGPQLLPVGASCDGFPDDELRTSPPFCFRGGRFGVEVRDATLHLTGVTILSAHDTGLYVYEGSTVDATDCIVWAPSPYSQEQQSCGVKLVHAEADIRRCLVLDHAFGFASIQSPRTVLEECMAVRGVNGFSIDQAHCSLRYCGADTGHVGVFVLNHSVASITGELHMVGTSAHLRTAPRTICGCFPSIYKGAVYGIESQASNTTCTGVTVLGGSDSGFSAYRGGSLQIEKCLVDLSSTDAAAFVFRNRTPLPECFTERGESKDVSRISAAASVKQSSPSAARSFTSSHDTCGPVGSPSSTFEPNRDGGAATSSMESRSLSAQSGGKTSGVKVWSGSVCRVLDSEVRYATFGFAAIGPQTLLEAHRCTAKHVVNGFTMDSATGYLSKCSVHSHHVGIYVLSQARCFVRRGSYTARRYGMECKGGIVYIQGHVKLYGFTRIGVYLHEGAHLHSDWDSLLNIKVSRTAAREDMPVERTLGPLPEESDAMALARIATMTVQPSVVFPVCLALDEATAMLQRGDFGGGARCAVSCAGGAYAHLMRCFIDGCELGINVLAGAHVVLSNSAIACAGYVALMVHDGGVFRAERMLGPQGLAQPAVLKDYGVLGVRTAQPTGGQNELPALRFALPLHGLWSSVRDFFLCQPRPSSWKDTDSTAAKEGGLPGRCHDNRPVKSSSPQNFTVGITSADVEKNEWLRSRAWRSPVEVVVPHERGLGDRRESSAIITGQDNSPIHIKQSCMSALPPPYIVTVCGSCVVEGRCTLDRIVLQPTALRRGRPSGLPMSTFRVEQPSLPHRMPLYSGRHDPPLGEGANTHCVGVCDGETDDVRLSREPDDSSGSVGGLIEVYRSGCLRLHQCVMELVTEAWPAASDSTPAPFAPASALPSPLIRCSGSRASVQMEHVVLRAAESATLTHTFNVTTTSLPLSDAVGVATSPTVSTKDTMAADRLRTACLRDAVDGQPGVAMLRLHDGATGVVRFLHDELHNCALGRGGMGLSSRQGGECGSLECRGGLCTMEALGGSQLHVAFACLQRVLCGDRAIIMLSHSTIASSHPLLVLHPRGALHASHCKLIGSGAMEPVRLMDAYLRLDHCTLSAGRDGPLVWARRSRIAHSCTSVRATGSSSEALMQCGTPAKSLSHHLCASLPATAGAAPAVLFPSFCNTDKDTVVEEVKSVSQWLQECMSNRWDKWGREPLPHSHALIGAAVAMTSICVWIYMRR